MIKRYNLEFWAGLSRPAICSACNYEANGSIFLWKLLDAPQSFTCYKCGYRWDIAIPLGDCEARRGILKLLEVEKQYYILLEQLTELENILHNRNLTPSNQCPNLLNPLDKPTAPWYPNSLISNIHNCRYEI